MDEEILDTSTDGITGEDTTDTPIDDVTDENNTEDTTDGDNTDTSTDDVTDGDNPSDDIPTEDVPVEDIQIEIQDSILLLIKKKLGIDRDYHAFDEDVITAINTVLFSLNQIGVGAEDFCITDETALWSDFLGESKSYEAVKSYIYIKVKLMFDPPSSSFVITALEKQALELEWRLNLKYETQLQDIGGEENGE